MQLILQMRPPVPVTLPIGYHHILQAVFYRLTSGGNINLHEHGDNYGSRVYKMFTFGDLKGHYIVKSGRITFDDIITWEIRSIHENVIDDILNNISDGIQLGNVPINNIDVKAYNAHIIDNDIWIRMATPICLKCTDILTGEEGYYNPSDVNFFRAAEDNFIRKYVAYFGMYPKDNIVLSKINVESKHRVISKYKNSYVEAYRGDYRLIGRPEYLDFLYQTGIGGRNSQGFGMFDVVQE